jgi:hypothetical protein
MPRERWDYRPSARFVPPTRPPYGEEFVTEPPLHEVEDPADKPREPQSAPLAKPIVERLSEVPAPEATTLSEPTPPREPIASTVTDENAGDADSDNDLPPAAMSPPSEPASKWRKWLSKLRPW